ncbi:hypothetical protein EI94DRAFT_1726581 [Lactarius quietus]|nr:hypothetical protein EI94DRAFT_1726581 [Lactarius quietus]
MRYGMESLGCLYVRSLSLNGWDVSIVGYYSVSRQTTASWCTNMLALHRHQRRSLQISKQDVLVVRLARRLRLNVPREEADGLLIHVEVPRAWTRLVVLHESLRLIDVPRGHDARVGRVDALRLTRLVWRARPRGSLGTLVHWRGLRAHPFPDALDEAKSSHI